jgi:hypothetical protein
MPTPIQYTGTYQFPGTYAFLERFNIVDYALIQFDSPYTGKFDELAARNTAIELQRNHHSGDPANLTGRILSQDIDGRPTPVLFVF